MPNDEIALSLLNSMEVRVAILETKVDGVESDMKELKKQLIAMQNSNLTQFASIRANTNKLIIGGLSSAVLLLVGSIINILISR